MMVREDRVNLLAARATIAVANNELETAEAAVAELEDLAARNDTTWERAAAAHASGLLSLTLGHASDAVDQLIKAKRWWVELNTPYELAKTRVLLSRALQAEGDRTQAKLELAAAHEGFERIGAEFDREETQTWLDDFDRLGDRGRHTQRPETEAAGMSRAGDMWTFTFNGRTVQLRSTRGVEHLAKLLERPGVDCWAVDLAGSGGVADGGDAGELLDATARQQYQRRAEELEAELAELDSASDPINVERIRTELDAIASELAAAVGLGGRSRRVGGAVERARQSVTKAIRGAIRKINEADEELGRYLEVTIKTGTACRFEPSLREPIEWTVHR